MFIGHKMVIFGSRPQSLAFWWQIIVQNTCFWNFWKIIVFEFLVHFHKNACHGAPGDLILLRPTPKSFFFHVVSRMTNSKIRPQKIWGIPADFAYIATSDFENWPKLYFTAKLAQFGLEMIIRPFSSKFWKKN